MEAFSYRDGQLFAEGVALPELAQRFGTPTYVYSRAHIEAQYRAYADALEGMPHGLFRRQGQLEPRCPERAGTSRRGLRHRLAR